MDIQRGYYVFVLDDEKSKASGAAFIGELESENYHLFEERFVKSYKGMYIVKFHYIDTYRAPVPPWNSDKVIYNVKSWGDRTWIAPFHNAQLLLKDKAIALKLLLKDSLSISAGRIKPLKLAINVANEIRTASESKFNNVPDVFQEYQENANAHILVTLSEISELKKSFTHAQNSTGMSPQPVLKQPESNVPIAPQVPPIFIAASDKKVPKSAKDVLEMYNADKHVTEPDEVVIAEFDTDALDGLKTIMPKSLTKEEMKEAVAEGVRDGLLQTDALSSPARQKEIKMKQEEVLLQQGNKPVDVARIHNPNANEAVIRKEAQRISNTHNARKKKKT